MFNNEKYDFTADMKDAYRRSLQQPIEKRIFDKIPDHVFWDIKTPIIGEFGNPIIRKGRFNPVRGRDYNDYFEMRDTEEYFHSQNSKRYLNDSVSKF